MCWEGLDGGQGAVVEVVLTSRAVEVYFLLALVLPMPDLSHYLALAHLYRSFAQSAPVAHCSRLKVPAVPKHPAAVSHQSTSASASHPLPGSPDLPHWVTQPPELQQI